MVIHCYGHRMISDVMPESERAAPRTILLDGLWGNPKRLSAMRRRLEKAGVPRVEGFAYRSSGFSCLIEEGKRLAAHIASDPSPVNLMGYSMGGLVIRAALAYRQSLPVQKVAFLNTPHQGSMLAGLLPGVGIGQMRPGCEFLAKLNAAAWKFETLAIWTPGDLMVVPASSANWSLATRVSICRVPAHVWPLFSPTVHREVAEFFLSQ